VHGGAFRLDGHLADGVRLDPRKVRIEAEARAIPGDLDRTRMRPNRRIDDVLPIGPI